MVRRALHQTQRGGRARRDRDEPDRLGPSLLRRRSRANAFAIEASGTRRKVVYQRFARSAAAYCHTNHCLDGEVAARSKVPATSTTYDRMKLARGRPRARADRATSTTPGSGSAPRRAGRSSICTNMATPEAPHGAATCGAIAMNLDTGELWAQQGFIHNVAPEKFHV